MSLSGNKGEWSEIYVFLRLLADGKLYSADANLNKINDLFYPIVKIIREESRKRLEYILNGEIQIVDSATKAVLASIETKQFLEVSKSLLARLKTTKGLAFSLPEIEEFLNSINCHSLTATKTKKADIRIVIHDMRTGQKPELGFSIKSLIGKNSTLFNPGRTTNFIYEITGCKKKIDIEEVNKITEEPKITKRLKYLTDNGCDLKFSAIESETFQLNLMLIDSRLPEIMAHLLKYKYTRNDGNNLKEMLKIINRENPLKFNNTQKHPYYEYKIKNFLTDAAMGLTPSQVWTGKYDATGGIIIVKKDGDIVCYHIYNRNEFQDYLLNNTRFEQASTERYGFGELYEEKSKLYIKLNLQIRFGQ